MKPTTAADTTGLLRKAWTRFFTFNWKFGLFLLLLVCIPRFILVLHANSGGSYSLIGVVMFLSALAPFISLNRNGLTEIGWKKTSRPLWLLLALLIGIGFSVGLHFVGEILFDHGPGNWYAYIGRSYKIPEAISADDKLIFFIIFAVTGMTFSPIGEELFFRGIVHSAFAHSVGDRKASLVDAAAFAFVHLSHFGIVFLNGHWSFLPVPALLWVLAMFVVSLLFFLSRKRSGSILGAIVCHAGFNLGMTWSIFYLL